MEIKSSIRNIDPESFLDAKLYAVETGQTLGEVISEAIDLMLHDANEGSDDGSVLSHPSGAEKAVEDTIGVTGPLALRKPSKIRSALRVHLPLVVPSRVRWPDILGLGSDYT